MWHSTTKGYLAHLLHWAPETNHCYCRDSLSDQKCLSVQQMSQPISLLIPTKKYISKNFEDKLMTSTNKSRYQDNKPKNECTHIPIHTHTRASWKLLYRISKILNNTDTRGYGSNSASSVALTICTVCIRAFCLVAYYSSGNFQLLWSCFKSASAIPSIP